MNVSFVFMSVKLNKSEYLIRMICPSNTRSAWDVVSLYEHENKQLLRVQHNLKHDTIYTTAHVTTDRFHTSFSLRHWKLRPGNVMLVIRHLFLQ